jgi:hypothetical protein
MDVNFSTLQCSDYDYLKSIYGPANEGLVDMINNAADKPPMEPTFPDFEVKETTCVL